MGVVGSEQEFCIGFFLIDSSKAPKHVIINQSALMVIVLNIRRRPTNGFKGLATYIRATRTNKMRSWRLEKRTIIWWQNIRENGAVPCMPAR